MGITFRKQTLTYKSRPTKLITATEIEHGISSTTLREFESSEVPNLTDFRANTRKQFVDPQSSKCCVVHVHKFTCLLRTLHRIAYRDSVMSRTNRPVIVRSAEKLQLIALGDGAQNLLRTVTSAVVVVRRVRGKEMTFYANLTFWPS